MTATDLDPWEQLCQLREVWMEELVRWPEACLQRPDTDAPIFHGCWDWHSAAHAHWAVLAVAGTRGHTERLEAIDARLQGEALEAEVRLLQDQPEFELPYGRAWLLRLALAHAEHTGSERLQSLADAQALRLREHFTATPPSPLLPEYSSASWALTQLDAWYRHRDQEDQRAWVIEQTRRHFSDPAAAPSLSEDQAERPEFFSRWGNQLLLVASVLGAEEAAAWLRAQEIPDRALEPPSQALTAHHLGMPFARAWGLWTAWEVSGEERWRSAYLDHVELGMVWHQRHREDYRSWGHWVPQFGIYALLASEGRCP